MAYCRISSVKSPKAGVPVNCAIHIEYPPMLNSIKFEEQMIILFNVLG